MFNKKIETKRLLLRPFELSDILPSFKLEQNPEINKYTNDGGIKSFEQVEKIIEKLINIDYKENGFGRFAIELKKTSEFIGFCGLKLLTETNEVDLGYRIKMKYWGMGFATEASKACLKYGFQTLQLKNIIAYILPENIKSKRVLQKLDFSFEKELVEEGELLHKYRIYKNNFIQKTK